MQLLFALVESAGGKVPQASLQLPEYFIIPLPVSRFFTGMNHSGLCWASVHVVTRHSSASRGCALDPLNAWPELKLLELAYAWYIVINAVDIAEIAFCM